MIRHDAWTGAELQVLYDLVNAVVWLDSALTLLPRRSKNAIQTAMSNLRAEAGIVPGVYGPRSMSTAKARRKSLSECSARLRDAILEAA